jgi:hypothetical protein
MRRKPSSSSTHPVYIRHGDGVVMIGFWQYKGHIMHFTHLHTSNTLHEDTMIITHSLIRGFLQTPSVDVINRVSFSYMAPGMGELHTSLELDHSLSIDAEDEKI